MKHLSAFAFTLAALATQAQVQNGGLEDLNSSGFPAYWQGEIFLLPIWVDSNGVFHSDSVEFDGGSLYSLTDDVHSGAHAIELRNAYNHTQDEGIPGGWLATNDSSVYSGFNLVFLPTGQQPEVLSFWAKYLPVGGDVGYARMDVFDEGQELIGSGVLELSDPYTAYTAFEVPITYTSANAPFMYTLNFRTASPTSPVTLGTRFLIDDVALTFSASVHEAAGADLHMFPVPAQDLLTIRTDGALQGRTVRITDISGRTTLHSMEADGTLDCSGLANGRYTLGLPLNGTWLQRPLVIAR